MNKKNLTNLFGFTLLILLGLALQASRTNMLSLFYPSLSLALLVIVYYCLNRQITKRQLVEANFQDLYNNAPCGYHSLDKDGTFIAINDTELSWLGYSRDEVIGKLKITDLLTPESAATFRENFPRFREQGWVKDLEFQLVRKDGTILPVLLNATFIGDAAGNFVATRSTLFDISERKQVEKSLAASEKRLRTIIEAEPQCVKVLALDNTIQQINAAGLAIIEADDLQQVLGQPADSFVVPKYRDLLTALTHQAAQGKPGNVEFEIVGLKGTHRWLESHAVPLPNEHNEITSVLSITRDITARKQAEADLRHNEEKLRLALEAANMGTWDWNILTNQITWSSGHERLFGLAVGSFDGTYETFDACLYPEDRDAINQSIERARIERQEYYQEYRVVWSDGSIHWIAAKGKFFYDEMGQAVRMLGTVMDISDRKHREEQLRLLESVVVNSNDAVLITEASPIDQPGPRIIYANAAFTRMTGYTSEELLGQTPRLLQGPKTDRATLDRIRAVLQNWQPIRVDLINYRKDGSEFWVDLSIVPVANEKGYFTHWISVQRDISDRKLAEVQLQQSEQKFRQLAENIQEVFWMSNADSTEILYVSPAYEQIWGRSCESLYTNPKSFLDAIHPEDKQQAIANIKQNTTRDFDLEYRIIRPDGLVRWVRDRGFPIRNESGEIYRRGGLAQDITQRKQAEAILRQINEELEIRVAQRTAELKQANQRLSAELFERQQVEQALSRAYQRLQFHVENTPLAVIEWNCELRLINWSRQAEKIFGWKIEEVYGNNPNDWRFIYEEDTEQVKGLIENLLNGSQASNSICNRNYTKDGSVIHCEWYNSALFDTSGNLVSILSLIQDVTERKRAEEALRQSEGRLQAILDNAPAVIYLKDTEGRFLLINRQCETLFHITNEQILGLTDYDLFPKEMADTVVAHARQVIEAGHPLKFEEIAPHEQEIHTYISIKFPLKDDAGVAYGVCGISTDISDRKRAEEALRESQAQLQAILDNSPTVMYLIDAQNRHLLVNRGYEKLVSLTNEQIIGRSIYDVWPHEIADAFAVNNQKVHEGGTPIEVEEVVPHNDGLHTYFSVKFPLRDANGVPYAVCGISTDITERKQAEETLSKQACIFENLYDGVILTDLEGRIIDWNPAAERIFGYTKTEVLGKTTGIFHKPEDSAVLSHKIIKGMLKAGRWAGEINFIRKDGTEGVCETVVVPLYNEQGQAIATIGVNSDISDRKQAEAALRRAYDELEIRVQERTRELAQANQELQSENTERKRVEAELQTRARQQAAVAELGQQALASQQLDPLIDQAVALIAQILEVEYCRVLELLPDGKALLLRAGVGWQEGLVGQATISVALESQAGYTLLASEPVVVEDLRSEKRFSGPTLLHQHGVVSGLSVIIPGQNHPYGVLGAHTTRRRKFTKDDVYFLQATANVLATAINRQQAEENLRRAHDELEIRVQERTRDLAKANAELQQEIIERKQAEEERAKLIAILEATPDFISSASVDGQVFYFNKSARKILGFDQGDDLRDVDIANGHPDWANEVIEKEGIPAAIRDGSWVGEAALLSHDGREIPLSQLIIAHKSPDGSVKMLSTIARDITQQKQIEATLREAERRWRSLLENVRLVVVGLDNNGFVEYVNPYFLELVGYTKAEVIGQDWFETFLPLHQRQRVQNNFLELLEQEFYIHNQNAILTKSGEEKVIAWNNTLLKDLQGNVIGTLSIGEDITERQVIERMKDEFISVVSHELRTPLTSIHGALNLLASGLVNTESEKGRRVIEIAAESAERLVRLVNDILELERLESGKISLSKQSCNAADLMIQATDMIQVMANRAGITLSVSPKAIQFEADPDRIIQVLTNLLGNAIKFSPRGSTVWLTVELQGTAESGTGALLRMEEWNRCFIEDGRNPTPTVVFKVKDQGRGIPADKIESIFERFHQVDASDSRKKGGTGLGLAICRSIVQQQGGQIWVESTLGEGSTFYFTLPGSIVEEDNHDNQANLGD